MESKGNGASVGSLSGSIIFRASPSPSPGGVGMYPSECVCYSFPPAGKGQSVPVAAGTLTHSLFMYNPEESESLDQGVSCSSQAASSLSPAFVVIMS